MALSNEATGAQGGQSASTPLRAIQFSFDGDDSYPTGGTAAFQAAFRLHMGEDVTVVAITDQSVGLNRAIYDFAADTLYIEVKSTGVERSAADDSGNSYQCIVWCK